MAVDPTTGTAFLGNVIPESRISDVSRKAQDVLFPQPNFGPPGLQSANYRQQFPGTTGFTIFDMFDGRVDYNVTSRDVLFGRVSWRRMPLSGVALSPTIGHYPQRRYGHSAIVSWTHTFSPALFGTQPPRKSRFVAIGRQLSYPLEF